MRKIINISTSDPNIYGLYSNGDTVIVMCDATNGDFTVNMPDAVSTENTMFSFIKKDSSLNIVTIAARAGQKIMNEDTQELTEQADELELNTDGENWW